MLGELEDIDTEDTPVDEQTCPWTDCSDECREVNLEFYEKNQQCVGKSDQQTQV